MGSLLSPILKMAATSSSSQSFLRHLEERVTKESSMRKEALRKHVRVGCLLVVVALAPYTSSNDVWWCVRSEPWLATYVARCMMRKPQLQKNVSIRWHRHKDFRLSIWYISMITLAQYQSTHFMLCNEIHIWIPHTYTLLRETTVHVPISLQL